MRYSSVDLGIMRLIYFLFKIALICLISVLCRGLMMSPLRLNLEKSFKRVSWPQPWVMWVRIARSKRMMPLRATCSIPSRKSLKRSLKNIKSFSKNIKSSRLPLLSSRPNWLKMKRSSKKHNSEFNSLMRKRKNLNSRPTNSQKRKKESANFKLHSFSKKNFFMRARKGMSERKLFLCRLSSGWITCTRKWRTFGVKFLPKWKLRRVSGVCCRVKVIQVSKMRVGKKTWWKNAVSN